MNDLIQDELRAVLAEWNAGKPVRTVALGHAVRLGPAVGNESAREVAISFRQRDALAYVFLLIANALGADPGLVLVGSLVQRNRFLLLVDAVADLRQVVDLDSSEREAAESLAWKALLRGWNIALSGFADHRYITVTNPRPQMAGNPAGENAGNGGTV